MNKIKSRGFVGFIQIFDQFIIAANLELRSNPYAELSDHFPAEMKTFSLLHQSNPNLLLRLLRFAFVKSCIPRHTPKTGVFSSKTFLSKICINPDFSSRAFLHQTRQHRARSVYRLRQFHFHLRKSLAFTPIFLNIF